MAPTLQPTMPSLRGRRYDVAADGRRNGPSRSVIVATVFVALISAFVAGSLFAALRDDTEAAPVPTDAGVDAGTSRRLEAPPPSWPDAAPVQASPSIDAGTAFLPKSRSRSGRRRPVERTSLAAEVEKANASSPPPTPGETLCEFRPNALIPLVRTHTFTTKVADFETYHNPNAICGAALDIALERVKGRIVVNDIRLDYRPACIANLTSTVLEMENTPDRSWAVWILPEGGTLTACPTKHSLPTRSRAERTPRQPSSSTPATTLSPTPEPSGWAWKPQR